MKPEVKLWYRTARTTKEPMDPMWRRQRCERRRTTVQEQVGLRALHAKQKLWMGRHPMPQLEPQRQIYGSNDRRQAR
jgi:hypothetical protein